MMSIGHKAYTATIRRTQLRSLPGLFIVSAVATVRFFYGDECIENSLPTSQVTVIPQSSILRIARPTANLETVSRMYIDGLGFKLLGEFKNHNGFDGRMIGHEHHAYHLEFTHHTEAVMGHAPSQDQLLVFYISDAMQWQVSCRDMLVAGFRQVEPYNKYWAIAGATFEDSDGYRVVLQNSDWSA